MVISWQAHKQEGSMLGRTPMTSAINNFTLLSTMQGILGLKTQHLNRSLLSFPPMKTPSIPVKYMYVDSQCWLFILHYSNCPKFTHVTGVGQHIHNYKQVFVQEAAWMLLYYSSNCRDDLRMTSPECTVLKHFQKCFGILLLTVRFKV